MSANSGAADWSKPRRILLVLIAAVADNGVIGQGGDMPWRLSADLQHFRRLTMGKPVVMGRKTYLSIGKPLTGRTTIVASRDPSLATCSIKSTLRR